MEDPPPPRTQKRKQEDDLEAIFKRKFLVKCRFRAVARMVLANIMWLDEDDSEHFQMSTVKKTVAKAVRSKTKPKQLLTINDKALLNKPAEDRSEEEKSYLYRILGGLKCFRRYPAVVKEKLASVTYFRYYGPGRVIVRQGHEAHALYFLVTGEVGVSQNVYDELLKQETTLQVGLMTAGDMFGEVSLLHDINRTATCTTNTDVELIVLMKEDFKNILQATVEDEWGKVKKAMSKFTYFDALDEVGRREACLVAKMHSYLPSETILGDGVGIPTFVYFVLSGQCRIIEALQIIISKSSSQKTLYTLYSPKEEVIEEVEQYNYERIFKKRLTPNIATQSVSTLVLPEASSEAVSEEIKICDQPTFSVEGKTSADIIVAGVERSLLAVVMDKDKSCSDTTIINSATSTLMEAANQNVDSQDTDNQDIHSQDNDNQDIDHQDIDPQDTSTVILRSKSSLVANSGLQKIAGVCGEMRSSGSAVLKTSFLEPSEKNITTTSSKDNSTLEEITQPPNLRTYFMQVCLMNPGSCFGLGENMKGRRIVAVDTVECLLLPRVWLFQRNTANIWSRIAHYLDRKVPSTKALFEEFVMGRRWDEFKTQIVEDIVETGHAVNWTTIHDVPYSIRIEEEIDI